MCYIYYIMGLLFVDSPGSVGFHTSESVIYLNTFLPPHLSSVKALQADYYPVVD